jgi:PAS domain S-box-containing protein
MAPQPSRPARRGNWLPLFLATLTLVVGLALTAVGVQLSRRHLDAADRQRFEAASAETERAFSNGMTLYFLVLRSVHGLIASSREVEPSESHRFYEALQADRHRGIRALGFVNVVGDAYRVEYAEPTQAGEGLDLRTEPVLAAALDEARQSGLATLTPLVRAGATEPRRPALLLFKALASPRPRGWAFVELAPLELFRELAGHAAAAEVAVQVTDTGAGGAVLYDTRDADTAPRFSDERTLRVGGRAWRLRLVPRPAFARASQSREPWLLLASGAVASLLAAALVAAIATSRRRALVLADSMTHELRQQQARIRLVLDNVADAIVAWDEAGRIEWANLAAWRLLGGGERMIGRQVDELMPGVDSRAAGGGRFETTASGGDADPRVLEVALSRLDRGGEPISVAVARDVSARRQGELRLHAQHATTRVLAEAGSLADATPRILEAICTGLGWDFGALWYVETTAGLLRCVETWRRQDAFASFDAATRASLFPMGVGLPGRIWQSGRPAWIEDVVADANFPRAGAARTAGLHGAFGFPIVGPSGILGVIEFFSRQIREPDEDLLRMVEAVGSQVGQYVERKRAESALEESRELTRSVIDHMLEGLIVFDTAGAIESVNAAAARMFGRPAREMVGQPLELLLPPAVAVRGEAFLDELREKGLNRVTEWEGCRPGGEVFPFELSLFEFRTGEGRHYAGNVRDLSGRREVERLKKEFVATVSHELRTPLTSIRGSLGLLAGGMLGDLPDEAREVVGMAQRNTLRLITLINDILDLERLEAGRMEIHLAPTSASSVIERSCDSVRVFAEEQGVEIVSEATSATLLGDGDRLVQVLVNLLSNAIKFSPRGSAVTVTTEEERGFVHLRVTDRGRGIPPDRLDDIFERFQQVEATDAREKGGTGLGLAISKTIVERHGGEMGVKSELGRGSTFHFSIRAALPVAALADPFLHTLSGFAGPGPDVLVVDDDVPFLGVVARQLLGAGLAVRTATTVEQAIDLARQRAPSLLVLDLGLPDGDGRMVVEALREDRKLGATPLLIYTGRDLSEGDVEALRLGPTHALTKSRGSDADFLGLVAQILGRPVAAGGRA